MRRRFALVIAVPFGLAAARNVSPVWIQQPVRRLLDVLRSSQVIRTRLL